MKSIKKLLISPSSAYNTYHEKYKFNLVWKISLFLILTSLCLLITNFDNGNEALASNLFTFLLSLLMLFSLYYTRRFKVAVYLVFIFGTLIILYSLSNLYYVNKVIDLMWMTAVSVFIFYMVGYKLGVISAIINYSALIIANFYIPKSSYLRSIETKTFELELENSMNIILAGGLTLYFIKQIIDHSISSEQKLSLANKNLKKQNKEKVVMLKEIHHRVKNNLQIVSSMLRLQANLANDEQVKKHFNEAVNRIGSMALIHEKIYQTDDLSNVNVKSYVETLINALIISYSSRKTIISSKVTSNIDTVDLDLLIPLGIIFNELITNSIKHGFEEKEEGEITISIIKKERLIIKYEDNGVGFDEDKNENFGTILINTFTEQLEGSYTLNKQNGVKYVFTI